MKEWFAERFKAAPMTCSQLCKSRMAVTFGDVADMGVEHSSGDLDPSVTRFSPALKPAA